MFSPDARLFLCRMADVAWRRQNRKIVAADRAVRDARTTESGLRDLTTQSGGEWSRNRLYGMMRKYIRHKSRERG